MISQRTMSRRSLSRAGGVLLCLAAALGCRAEDDDDGARRSPLIALVVDAGPAPDAALPDAQVAQVAMIAHPLFWRLDKDGQTSYLLGTFHGGVDPAALPEVVWQRLAQARTFAMETDVTRASELYRHRRRGPSIKAALGPTYWRKLEAALGAKRALALINDIPASAQGALTLRTIPRTASMDLALRDRALAAGKPVVFLEPLERPLALLDTWLTVRTLRDAIDDASANDQRMQAEVAAYLAGDQRQLLALAADERRQARTHGHSPRELDARATQLLYARNAAWLAPIERLHAAGGAFIAVGAAHTIGPRSLIELLARRGFTITRL
jgi:uncharacterized protein YbaP (TraB family)